MRGICAALIVILCSCGNQTRGPYDDLPLEDERRIGGLDGPIHLARDQFGIWHVRASSQGDAAFANGYLHARDRFWQLELGRRASSGRLSELFGAVRPELLAVDVDARIHRLRPVAEQTFAELSASSDSFDRELAHSLTRYADGVNQYREELLAGTAHNPGAYEVLLPAKVFEPWTAVDSLTIGRFQAFNLSYQGYEISWSAIAQRAREIGRPELLEELFPIAPMEAVATLPLAKPGSPNHRPPRGAALPIDDALLIGAAQAAAPKPLLGRVMSRDEKDGSNNWVVGPAMTGNGAILANDPHLQLVSPALFYFIHLSVGEEFEVAGASFPGVPGVVLGHNRHLAWGGTVVAHDVTDFYREQIVPCASGGDCVLFRDKPVAIQKRVEEIGIGYQGQVFETRRVVIEDVPHHGPILPIIENGQVVPRSGDTAISVRWTGHEPTWENRALARLWRADNVEQGMAAFADFGIGAQNWVLADSQGNIGWTTHARVPWRSDGCFTFDAKTALGVAPYLIVPGDGTCEWEGYMEFGALPHAYNPAQGFLASANADPVGWTHDGDVVSGPVFNGRHIYLQARYDPGPRVARIHSVLGEHRTAGGPVGLEEMASLQADGRANEAALFRPAILAAADRLSAELAAPGTHADLSGFATSLPGERQARLFAAVDRLRRWDFSTSGDGSSATATFQAWMVEFLPRVLGEKAALVGADRLFSVSALVPGALALIKRSDQSLAIVEALDGALGKLAAEPRWEELHRLTLSALLPVPELNIPPPADPDPKLAGGYPRHGTPYSVDVGPGGYDSLDFSFAHGPAMRHVTAMTDGEPVTWLALAGGQSYDPDNPHFRDLMDTYWSKNAYFTLPWTPEQVVDAGEARIELLPAD